MEERKYYVLCGANCKYEGMTKEQIYNAILQAVENGEIGDIDTGFVTNIKEMNKGKGISLWVGTQAEYNALETKAENCIYIISDDTLKDDLIYEVEQLRVLVEEISKKVINVSEEITEQNKKIETMWKKTAGESEAIYLVNKDTAEEILIGYMRVGGDNNCIYSIYYQVPAGTYFSIDNYYFKNMPAGQFILNAYILGETIVESSHLINIKKKNTPPQSVPVSLQVLADEVGTIFGVGCYNRIVGENFNNLIEL